MLLLALSLRSSVQDKNLFHQKFNKVRNTFNALKVFIKIGALFWGFKCIRTLIKFFVIKIIFLYCTFNESIIKWLDYLYGYTFLLFLVLCMKLCKFRILSVLFGLRNMIVKKALLTRITPFFMESLKFSPQRISPQIIIIIIMNGSIR